MVHQNPLVLDEEQRRVLENGGGTSETTNALRMVIGKNFEEYCVYHEEEWCKKPLEAPDWWTNAAGKPRKVEELLLDECLPVFSGYLKNWLWTMQVLSWFSELFDVVTVTLWWVIICILKVTKKSKGGEERSDFPSVNTAESNRSHLKNYLLNTYKVPCFKTGELWILNLVRWIWTTKWGFRSGLVGGRVTRVRCWSHTARCRFSYVIS